FPCPHCHGRLKAQPTDAGKGAKCRKCGHLVLVPAPNCSPPGKPVVSTFRQPDKSLKEVSNVVYKPPTRANQSPGRMVKGVLLTVAGMLLSLLATVGLGSWRLIAKV